MKAIHKRWLVPVLILLLGAFAAGSEAAENFFDLFNLTESIDGYYTMKDLKDGSPVLRTARILHVGDEFIDEQNRHFRVVKLEEKTAWAEQVESSRSPAGDAQAPLAYAAAGDEKKKPSIGIYHTHGAESYVPTDGTETIDQGGGILKVGDTLARALEEKGFDVNHVREPHTPHDAGAYQRSRRTAKKLLAQEMTLSLTCTAMPCLLKNTKRKWKEKRSPDPAGRGAAEPKRGQQPGLCP